MTFSVRLLLLASAIALLGGCGARFEPESEGGATGELGPGSGLVAISLPAGARPDQIHFVVSQGDALVATGDVPTGGAANGQLAFAVSLPAGTGYRIELSASNPTAAGAQACSGAFSPFDVKPAVSTPILLALTCHR